MVAQFVVLKFVLVDKKIVSLAKIEGKRGIDYIRIGMLQVSNKQKKRNKCNLKIFYSVWYRPSRCIEFFLFSINNNNRWSYYASIIKHEIENFGVMKITQYCQR